MMLPDGVHIVAWCGVCVRLPQHEKKQQKKFNFSSSFSAHAPHQGSTTSDHKHAEHAEHHKGWDHSTIHISWCFASELCALSTLRVRYHSGPPRGALLSKNSLISSAIFGRVDSCVSAEFNSLNQLISCFERHLYSYCFLLLAPLSSFPSPNNHFLFFFCGHQSSNATVN